MCAGSLVACNVLYATVFTHKTPALSRIVLYLVKKRETKLHSITGQFNVAWLLRSVNMQHRKIKIHFTNDFKVLFNSAYNSPSSTFWFDRSHAVMLVFLVALHRHNSLK